MNKLQRLEEMESQIKSLKAEIEADQAVEVWEPKTGRWSVWRYFISKDTSTNDCRVRGYEAQTMQRAERRLIMLNTAAIIDSYIEEHAPDWVADWSDDSLKWVIGYNHQSKEWAVTAMRFCEKPYEPTGPGDVITQLAADLNSGRVVLPT